MVATEIENKNQMQKIVKFIGLLITSGLLLYSCDSKAVFSAYKTLPNQWHKDSVAAFKFKSPDTTNTYNLFVELRNTNKYAYNNLFLIIALNHPNGKVQIDTLEYKMAAPDGELLGEGFSDVKENKLWYRGYESPFRFSEMGSYQVNIQHAMRKQGQEDGIVDLAGITDVGFKIEREDSK